MTDDILEKELNIVQCQFLSVYDSKLVNWKFWTENLSWTTQKAIFDRTAGHKLNKTYPIKVSYQLAFLSKLLEIINSKSEDVHDEIYEYYCKLMQNNKYEFSYAHYCILNSKKTISLKEYQAFVAHGTTGLCTWEGSLALGNWLLNNTEIVEGKTIIELGAGTGLCGFIAAKCCKSNEVIFTDGSPKVLELLNENIQINFQCEEVKKDDSTLTHYQYNHGKKNLKTLLLPWGSVDEHMKNLSKPDVILAADVTYDPDCLLPLVDVIDVLFKMASNNCTMIMAATVRKEDTISDFLSFLKLKQFNVEVSHQFGPEILYWRKDTPIQLLKISKTAK